MLPPSMSHFSSVLEKAIKLIPASYKLSYKPHTGYVANSVIFFNLNISIIHNDLVNVMADFDIAISANSTSASVDAFQSGLPVTIVYDESELNLSPLINSKAFGLLKTKMNYRMLYYRRTNRYH